MNTRDLPLPPHSIEAEQSLIGGLLIDNTAWDRIAGLIRMGDFYSGEHRRIFRHIAALLDRGQAADVVTVHAAIQAAGEADQAGGLAYLVELANNTASTANIKRYAEIVRERAALRALYEAAETIQAECIASGIADPEKIAQRADLAFAVALDREDGEPWSAADAFGEAMGYIDARGETGGLATGFHDFDGMTGGLEPGQLVVIAARPSVGKTALALNIADHVATEGGSALFFSLEMSRREVAMRLLSARAGVSVHAMRSGTRDQGDWKRMTEETARAAKLRLFIDDKPAIGLGYARARARRMKRQRGLDLLVIDYLQLMKGQGDNRTQEIGSLSRGLKALAKELQVPVIALAQLNRGTETRQDKRPLMSDLRDSGEIEQDADIVAMLHRESLYNAAPEWSGVAELLVRKNRNGPTGDAFLGWWPNETRFTNYTGPNPRRVAAAGAARRGFDN